MTPAGPETDEELMVRLRTGQDSALNSLMERWEVPLRRFLFRYLQSDAQALDIAQEVFVKIYQNRDRFSPGRRFSTWMFAIATNLARNHLRWRKRHPSESLDGSSAVDLAKEDSLRDDVTPADRLGSVERAGAVREAISLLPEELKAPLLLFEYEDLQQAEIAQVLGCSAKAVESRLYRARGLLRRTLERFLTESSRV